MFTAMFRAFDQLGDPPVRRVIWVSVLGALGLALVLAVAVGFTLTSFDLFSWGWVDTTLDVLGTLGVVVLTFLMLPAVIGLISSLLLDRVAEAVDARHYPALGPPRSQSLAEAIGTGVRFLFVLLFFNLLALPLFLVPVLNIVVLYGVNGYLLGREYFEMVALRRMPPAEMRRLRSAERGRVFVAGIAIAMLLSVPFLNLLVPILATAFMIHVFQKVAGRT